MGSILQLEQLKQIRFILREKNKKVVFTNGCFDVLHGGHVEFLRKAKTFGDILIVGINTDSSVQRIKGNKRPIIEQEERAFIVANLKPVDYVCLFDEDTPINLINTLQPDVLIKGADWQLNQIVGKDLVENYGGKVVIIELTPGKSTSIIIDRILKRYSP